MENISETILNLLDQWEAGTINELEVLNESEKLYLQHYQGNEIPKSDYKSIPIEVLSHLEILHHQWIIKDDIPIIRTFLNTSDGNELEAWKNWEKYWNAIDLDNRKEQIKNIELYTAKG